MAVNITAIQRVRDLLHGMDITDNASIRHLAVTESQLRTVAVELFGPWESIITGMDAYCEAAESWDALLHLWQSSSFAADRLAAAQGARLTADPSAAADPPPPVSDAVALRLQSLPLVSTPVSLPLVSTPASS